MKYEPIPKEDRRWMWEAGLTYHYFAGQLVPQDATIHPRYVESYVLYKCRED